MAIEQDLEANVGLEQLLIERVNGILPIKTRKSDNIGCVSVIKGKHLKIILGTFYRLKFWRVDKYLGSLSRISNTKPDLVKDYYDRYDGSRFPKQFLFNYVECYKNDDRYENFFPSKGALSLVLAAMMLMKLIKTEQSSYNNTQDIVVTEDAYSIIDTWSRSVHQMCENDICNLLEVYLQHGRSNEVARG